MRQIYATTWKMVTAIHATEPDKNDKSGKVQDKKDEQDIKDDYQLNEALNLLKGVNIVRQMK